MESLVKAAAAVVAAIITYLFGGWSALLGMLLVLAVIDYLSGFAAAAKRGQLSSSVGAWGIAKKVGMFGVVAVAHLVDSALGEAHLIRDAAIYWYLANELLSVAENMGDLGVPIPPPITQAVAVLRQRGGGSGDR